MRIYKVNKEYTVDLKRIVSVRIYQYEKTEDGHLEGDGWFEIILDTDQILDINCSAEEINQMYDQLIDAWKEYVGDKENAKTYIIPDNKSKRRQKHCK
ncbi:hypothetical protein IJI79_01945 [Candidatus Saccharibacteria bacterium]|nr:hypothetical protein [Candidatus Saccharibacteria bacterium]MBR0424240.1 hypothetical protein [Candidatus Saccharibacteria bacterium]